MSQMRLVLCAHTALIYDVLHHITDRETYLKNEGLKPAEEFALFDDKWFVIYSK